MHPTIPTPTPDRTVFATFVAALPVVAPLLERVQPERVQVAGVRLIEDVPSIGGYRKTTPLERFRCGEASHPRRGIRMGASSKQPEFVNLKVAVH